MSFDPSPHAASQPPQHPQSFPSAQGFGGPNQFHAPVDRPHEPTQQELRGRLRHPGELPWLIVACAMGALFYLIAFLYLLDGMFDWGWFDGFRDGSSAQLMLLVGVTPIMLFFARGIMYGQLRTSGVRMTPTQFPEGYRMVVEAARAANLPKVPDAYVITGSGVINAFASGHGFRRFVTVHSDLFEVGGAARDPQALRFVISHEVGHLAAGHTSYWRLVGINLFSSIPILGNFLSRAQEYTADNYGYHVCPEGSAGAMKVLSGGKYLNANVNFDEFADRSTHEKGFFTWAANLNSTHPILTWRAQGLRDRNKAGALFLRPKFRPLAPPSLPSGTELDQHPSPAAAIAFMDAFPYRGAPQFGKNFPQPLPGSEIATPDQTGYGDRTLTNDWRTREAPPLPQPGQNPYQQQQYGSPGQQHPDQQYGQQPSQQPHQPHGQQQYGEQQHSQPQYGQQQYGQQSQQQTPSAPGSATPPPPQQGGWSHQPGQTDHPHPDNRDHRNGDQQW